jgi:hypothetical protein
VRDEILVRRSSWRRFGRVPVFDEESMDRLLFFGSHLGSKLFKQVKTPGALLNDRVYPPQLSPVPRGSEEEVEPSPEKKDPPLYRRTASSPRCVRSLFSIRLGQCFISSPRPAWPAWSASDRIYSNSGKSAS